MIQTSAVSTFHRAGPMPLERIIVRFKFLAALSLSILLTGCSLTPTALPTAKGGASITGNLHGGQQPIAGAHIYLFAAGTSGYGSPSPRS
jgi:hypothetical protein